VTGATRSPAEGPSPLGAYMGPVDYNRLTALRPITTLHRREATSAMQAASALTAQSGVKRPETQRELLAGWSLLVFSASYGIALASLVSS
jgi:hypothetical protein